MSNDASTHGLWVASAPSAPPTLPLKEDVVAEVVIVGAGFTGLSAALHLANAGVSTIVVEAAEIGFGGSGRNVGLVNAGMWVMPSLLPDALGEIHGQRLIKQLGDAPALVFEIVDRYEIDCQLVRKGTLHCAADRYGLAEIEERAKQWQGLGAPVQLLGRAETAAKTGTDAYLGSLLDLRAGTIQPLAYVRGLARAASNAGAKIHSSSAVVAVNDLGDSWQIQVSSGGSVRAKWVLVASNAYTGPNGIWAAVQNELVKLPYFNLATAPLPATLSSTILPERQGAWDTRQILSSFRFDREGRLIFGSVGALRGTGRDVHKAWARRSLAKLFPQLSSVDFDHEWYGTIGMTANSLPCFHELERNTFSFSGYNGRGIAPGTTFGRDLAHLVLGKTTCAQLSLPVTAPSRASLKGVREAMYEYGAQAIHLIEARF